MNAKRNIIECIFEINTDKLEINKKKIENFYDFISDIVKNSHFFLKLSYKLIIYQLLFINFLLLILFLNKKYKKFILKKIIKIFEKFFLYKNTFKLLRIYSLIYFYE